MSASDDPLTTRKVVLKQTGHAPDRSPPPRPAARPGEEGPTLRTDAGSTERPGSPRRAQPIDSRAATLEGDTAAALGAATAPPTQIGPYEIVKELGRGGMGVVYKAQDPRLHRLVALKVILSGAHASADELQRFLTEAEAAAHLRHPNIVPIYDVGRESDRPYFTMELCEGGSLADRLNGTPMSPAEAAPLVETLARAVHYAHEQGIVHRDLKPGNVMFTECGTPTADGPARPTPEASPAAIPKIADFSLAKRIEMKEGLTASGAVLGTPSYMAPEQATGHSKDTGPPADIYALGAILYECLTGRPPFRGTTVYDTIEQVKLMEPVPPTRFQVRLPRDLETICLKCLEKEPARRYPSAGALADDLRRFQIGEPIQARPATTIERGVKWVRRRPTVAALSGAIVLVAAVAFALVTWKWREAEHAWQSESAERQRADEARTEADTRAVAEREARALADTERARADAARQLAEEQLYRNRIALADREWRSNNIAGALRLLDACPPPLRSWEWQHLRRLCHLELRSWRVPEGRINGVAYAPDGRTVAAAGTDGKVYLWDAETGRETAAANGHSGPVWAIAYNRDGSRFATAGDDGTVRLWDGASAREIWVLRGHAAAAADVAFSPDGALVAAGGLDGTVRTWDARLSDSAAVWRLGHLPVLGIAYAPDGQQIAVAQGDTKRAGTGELRVLDTKTGNEVRKLVGHTDGVTSVVWSTDGRRIASGSYDRTARLWDAVTGRELATLRGPSYPVHAVALSNDGAFLAVASQDQTVSVWDVAALERAFRPAGGAPLDAASVQEPVLLRGHIATVTGVAFHPLRPVRLVSSSADGTVRAWDQASSREALALVRRGGRRTGEGMALAMRAVTTEEGEAARAGPPGEVRAVAVHPRESRGVAVLALREGLSLVTTDLSEGTTIPQNWPTVATTGRPTAVACTAHDNLFAFLGKDEEGRPLLALCRGGAVVRSWTEGVPRDGAALAFDSAGRRLAAPGEKGTVRVFDVTTGDIVQTLSEADGAVTALAFAPDSRYLLAGTGKGELRAWDVATGAERCRASASSSPITAVVFSHDGRRFASAGRDRTVRTWDAATGAAQTTISGLAAPALALAFTPDDRRLATAGEETVTRLWDVASGEEVLVLRGHTDLVRSLAFSADGRWLVSGGRDGLVLARAAEGP